MDQEGTEVADLLDKNELASKMLTETDERLWSNGRYVSLVDGWALCMENLGFAELPTSPLDIEGFLIEAALTRLGPIEESTAMLDELSQLGDDERNIRAANEECGVNPGVVKEIMTLRDETLEQVRAEMS